MTVFGTGYLGATQAECVAEFGHEVLGVDADAARLEAVEGPTLEIGIEEAPKRNVAAGRLRVTCLPEETAPFVKVRPIGVGTLRKKVEFAADTVKSKVETLAPLIRVPAVIFANSTVPIGVVARLVGTAITTSAHGLLFRTPSPPV